MVTKAKTAPEAEVKTEEPDTKVESDPVTKSDVVEIVRDAIKDLLPGGETKVEETETKVDDKPETYRQEETRTHNVVLDKIEELKAAFDQAKENKPEKVEPESEPGKKETRWIERIVWGKD